jgi:hypothetical protein
MRTFKRENGPDKTSKEMDLEVPTAAELTEVGVEEPSKERKWIRPLNYESKSRWRFCDPSGEKDVYLL